MGEILDIYHDVWLVARRYSGTYARVMVALSLPILLALGMGSLVEFDRVVALEGGIRVDEEALLLAILRVTVIYGPISLAITGSILAIMVATAVAGWQNLHGRPSSLRGVLISTHDHRWRLIGTAFILLILPWIATLGGVWAQFQSGRLDGGSSLLGSSIFSISSFAIPVLLYSFLLSDRLLSRVIKPQFRGHHWHFKALFRSLLNGGFYGVIALNILWLLQRVWGGNLAEAYTLLAHPLAVVIIAVGIAPLRALIFVCAFKRRLRDDAIQGRNADAAPHF